MFQFELVDIPSYAHFLLPWPYFYVGSYMCQCSQQIHTSKQNALPSCLARVLGILKSNSEIIIFPIRYELTFEDSSMETSSISTHILSLKDKLPYFKMLPHWYNTIFVFFPQGFCNHQGQSYENISFEHIIVFLHRNIVPIFQLLVLYEHLLIMPIYSRNF